MNRGLTLIAASALWLAGCGGGSSPTTPTPTGSGSTVTSLTILGPSFMNYPFAGNLVFALAQHSNLTSADVTASTTWTSSNTQVAAFTAPGVVSTFRSGTFTITAAYSGRTATQNVSVQ